MTNAIIAICFILSISTLAQSSDENDESFLYRLDPVVVTATRTPLRFSQLTRSVSVIDSEDIDNSGAHSVEDLLKYSMGVDIRERGPYGIQADPSIRGSTFSQVLISVNGLRVNDPQTAHHNFDLGIPLDSIKQVEILHGHGSSLYGADAFGGVINIITKKPEKRNGYMGVSYGNYKTSIVNGGFSEKIGNFGSSLSLERKKSDGYRFDTDFNTIGLSSNSTLSLSDFGSLDFLLGYTDKAFGANDFYGPYPSKEWTETIFMGLGSELKKISTNPRVYYRRHKDKYLLDITKPGLYTNHHTTHMYGIETLSRISLKQYGNIIIGGEGGGEKIESTKLGDHNTLKGSAYAASEIDFANRFIFNLGIRGDYQSIYGLNWSPSVSAGWNISSFKVRSSVGKTFRAPSFTELYYEDPANLGNSQLKPENAWSYELGIDYYLKDQLRFSTTSFRRDETNLIDWIKKDLNSLQWKAENITKAQVEGIETALEIKPIKSSSVLVNYTFLKSHLSKNGNYVSKYSLNHPIHQLGATINQKMPFGTQILMAIIYKERTAEKGYITLDTRISKRLLMGEIYIDGNNLLNTEYQEIKGIPMPGRWLQCGVKLNI